MSETARQRAQWDKFFQPANVPNRLDSRRGMGVTLYNREDVRGALNAVVKRHGSAGHKAAAEVLRTFGGVGTLATLPVSRFGLVIGACALLCLGELKRV